MSGKFLIRSIGVITCMAVVASGWDAEAGWRRHHRRAASCCEPVCCEPVCCEPVVYESVCCEPVRETVCCQPVRETVCCETVRETVIVPASTCCNGQIVMTATESIEVASVVTPEPTPARETKATPAALKR
jgi:hypothetical protein